MWKIPLVSSTLIFNFITDLECLPWICCSADGSAKVGNWEKGELRGPYVHIFADGTKEER